MGEPRWPEKRGAHWVSIAVGDQVLTKWGPNVTKLDQVGTKVDQEGAKCDQIRMPSVTKCGPSVDQVVAK